MHKFQQFQEALRLIMRKILLCKLFALALVYYYPKILIAQNGIFECYYSKMRAFKLQSRLLKQNSPDANIDIKFYKLDLSIDPDNNFLSGVATVNAKVLTRSLNQFHLDLKNNMSVQKVTSNNVEVSYSHANNLLSIQLEKEYTNDKIFSVNIHYSGTPSVDSIYGLPLRIEEYNGHKVAFTHSQPFWASYWFPCKDDPSDKADSAKIWVTADSYYKVASNGILEEETDNGDGTKTFKWATRYPISNYLICVTMSDYVVYQNEFTYGNSETMPMLHYVWSGDFSKHQDVLDFTIDIMHFFSDAFGLYPFIDEKYGHAQATGGAMEHQTMTTMYRSAPWSNSVTAHELAHHWFGNAVTFKSYHHIWLSEGFASYCDLLHVENFEGKQNFINDLNFYANSPAQPEFAAKNAIGTLYIEDITSESKILHPGKTYRKGAWVLHMLRGVVGDEVFFTTMKNYANAPTLKYNSAETSDFQNIAEQTSGVDLDYFFNQWVYGENYPKYSVQWGFTQTANSYEVNMNLNQDVNTNPPFFTMPVQVLFTTSTGDTLITLFNNEQNQNFRITLNSEPTELQLDPNNWILKDVQQIVVSVNEESLPLNFSLDQNYPNPFNPNTAIKYQIPKRSNVLLKIYNLLGKEVKSLIETEQSSGTYSVEWSGLNNSGEKLSSGIYFYRIEAGNFVDVKKMILIK